MSPQPSLRIPDHSANHLSDAAYYRDILHELIDLGADLARLVHAQATAEPGPDPTVPFERIARCVRRTIALARSLDQPPPSHRFATRKRIIREVEDAIQRRCAPGDAESLYAEFLERLDAPDLDDDIDERPAADIIADICRDLGLDNPPGQQPWKRRTPADIVAICARAARLEPDPAIPARAVDDG